jgi:serine/threonine protein kinase
MEYCKGGSLQSFLERNGILKEDCAALLMFQLANVLSYIHRRGVAHRDIKPENILISRWPLIKLSDFGLCGFISKGLLTDPCGSPAFAPPECFTSYPYNGMASDMWSLGVTLYALVTCTMPWDMRTYQGMVADIRSGRIADPKVSADCKDLIFSLLQADPRKRLTADAVLQHPFVKNVNLQPLERLGGSAIFSKGPLQTIEIQRPVSDIISENRPITNCRDREISLPQKISRAISLSLIVQRGTGVPVLPKLVWANDFVG